MKLKSTYQREAGYLYVKVTGEFDLLSAQAIFREWVETARSLVVNRVLCDLTLVRGFDAERTSITNRFELGKFAAETIPRNIRFAVLQTEQQCEKDRFIENVMANRGSRGIVTTSLNKALEWLGAASIKKTAVHVGEQPHFSE